MMSEKEEQPQIQITKVAIPDRPVSPSSPGQLSPNHRSEIMLRLSKQLNLTEVAEVTHVGSMNGDLSGESEEDVPKGNKKAWINMYESVMQDNLGLEGYSEAVEKQRKIFKSSCQDGSIIKDVGIYLKEEKLKTLTGLRSLRMRLRNNQGIGLSGYAVFESNDLVSHDPFFTPGNAIEVTAVHSNYPFSDDDATACLRTLGLKFSLHPSTSPLDLMFHTGNISPAFNADAVHEYARNILNEESRKKYLLSLPVYLQAYIEGVRSAPSSYYHQHYYSHVTYNVKQKDAVKTPCRFRIIPADGSGESGRLTPYQQKKAWCVDRSPDDNRPPDYLKTELRHRLTRGPIEYILQIVDMQIQHPDETETHLCHMHYNAAIPWTNMYHRWTTLATIKLTHLLPEESTELVRYNIANMPPCLSLPEVHSNDDFNLVPYILKDACEAVDHIIPVSPTSDRMVPDDDSTEYLIYIVTSSRPDAGNDNDVTMSLIGSEGRTAFRKIHQAWHDDVNKGNKRTYVLTDRPVGDILYLKVYSHVPKTAAPVEWLLESVTVATPYNEKCYSFPCYKWIPSRQVVTLRHGKALLPNMERMPLLRLERQLELQAAKQRYPWRKVEPQDQFYGLPGHLSAGDDTKAVPREFLWEGFSNAEDLWLNHNKSSVSTFKKLKRTLSDYLTYKKSDALEPFIGLVADLVEEHPALYQNMKLWTSDEVFGRQMLNGSNPVTLKRISKLPVDFLDKAPDLDLYIENSSFQDQLEAGRVYMASYPALRPLESSDLVKRERHLCVPQVILYAPMGQTVLLPLAIHINYGENENPSTKIFTPSDDVGNPSPWLLAKMWVRCAEVHYHLLDSYLLKTVFMMEAVTIALFRNMSHVHPIYKLLHPHIQHMPAVGTLWRKILLSKEGALSQVLSVGEHHDDMMELLRRLTSQANFSQLHPEENLTTRGVLDPSVLPEYFYRDDGLKVCAVIGHHCSRIIDLFYFDDEEVALDEELQDFMTDLKENGLPTDKDLPPRLNTKRELVHFLTTVIFQTTAQPHALTSGSLDDMAFVPLSPPALRLVKQNDESSGYTKQESFQQYQQTLPSPFLGASYIEMMKLLSSTKASTTLGSNSEKNFIEANVISCKKIFKKDMNEIGKSMVDRNKVILQPYTALLPENIPNCLTV